MARNKLALASVFLASALASLTARGEEPRVDLAVSIEGLSLPEAGVLLEVSHDGETEPVSYQLGSKRRATLSLEAGRRWTIEATAGGYWAAPIDVDLHDVVGPQFDATFTFLPLTQLRFVPRFYKERRKKNLRVSVEVREALARSNRLEQSRYSWRFECGGGDGVVSCELPVGTYDIRVVTVGYAPVYLWGVQVAEKGERRSGGDNPLVLRKGGSILGVIPEAASSESQDHILEAKLMGEAFLSKDVQMAMRDQSQLGRIDKDGSFQIVGLRDGIYVLDVMSRDGVRLARVSEVRVVEDRETRLERPIFLVQPAAVEVSVVPPLPPTGEGWHVEIFEKQSETKLRSIAGALAGPDGTLRVEDVPAGDYLVRVFLGSRGRWADHEVEIGEGSREVFVQIDIPVIVINGSLLYGSQPGPGRLWFGGRSGSQRIEVVAGEGGTFSGYLPRPGRWELAVEPGPSEAGYPALIKLDPIEIPEARRGKDEVVEVRVPGTELSGRVEFPDGAGSGGATIKAWRIREGKAERVASIQAGSNGEFVVKGLPEGPVAIEAEADDDWASEQNAVELSEANSVKVTLRLAKMVEARGMVTLGGVPFPGATIELLSADGRTGSSFLARSGIDGEFVVRAPSGPYHGLLVAPGVAFRLFPASISRQGLSPSTVALNEARGSIVLREGKTKMERGTPILVFEGVPVSLSKIFARGAFHPLGEGEGEIMDAAPGEYVLCSASGGGCKAEQLVAGSRIEFELP